MANSRELPHLKVDRFHEPKKYEYPKTVVIDFPLAQQNRAIHGKNLLRQLESIRDQFKILKTKPLPNNIIRDDALYVEFYSEFNLPLKFESLTQENEEPEYQILNIKEEIFAEDGSEKKRYLVVVMMREGGVSKFIKKVYKYLTETTKDKDGNLTATPKNNPLLANIAKIQLASLESFWSDAPEIPFPQVDTFIWWEVWFRKTANDGTRINNVLQNLAEVGAQISSQTLEFPEHRIRLVRATANQLSSSLLLLDNLAELRKPQEINDFVLGKNIGYPAQKQWLDDLALRTEAHIDDNSVIVCLLDSGVNNKHPLLSSFLPDDRLYSYKAAWGTNDSSPNCGHGTGMAGLAIYGDLTNALALRDKIQIYYGLESFKIIHPNDPNDPVFYGPLTEYACSVPYINHPFNKRVFCLAVTDSSTSNYGRPSSWSSAIDKIANGNVFEPQLQQLIIVSGGNVDYNSGSPMTDYPAKNELESIHDPAQSYNALVIGAYTRMDRVDQNVWPGVSILAKHGGMAPANSTSLTWNSQWPIKPDLVLEGGNLGIQNTQIIDTVHSLRPLSLDKEIRNYLFTPFGDTSGAAALAAKMAAELTQRYPDFWPETIRGLLVHSAEWTNAMLNGISFSNASVSAKRSLLRSYGYGVPILENALYSAENALTLIAENSLQPYKEDGSIKYNEYHLYNIPWPKEVLQSDLAEDNVNLKVTLSYFIDPNPGNKRYANNYHYHSHSLDFKVIKPAEDLAAFKRRISAASEGEDDPAYVGSDEPWSLKENIRNKGSIKKDFIITSGADLSTRNVIAIYPKSGWYKTRKKLNKYTSIVRYSLIISIETEKQGVNIYNPVLQLVPVELPAS